MYLNEVSPLLEGLSVGLSQRVFVLFSKLFDNQEHVDYLYQEYAHKWRLKIFFLPIPWIFFECLLCTGASQVAQLVENMPAVQDTRVQPLGWEDPLEKEMATYSSTVDWKISWTERRAWQARVHEVTGVGHDLATKPLLYTRCVCLWRTQSLAEDINKWITRNSVFGARSTLVTKHNSVKKDLFRDKGL